MLKSIDQALAGAIDVIADDVQATVKSVREQGMMRTLGDAVEDAAGLVVGGAGSAISGMWNGKKGEKTVSGHSGVSSGYADICAGSKAGSFSGGAAAFPYVPNSGPAPAKGPMNFGPGIGIRLPNQPTGAPAGAPPIMPYAGAAGAGQFRPPPAPPAPPAPAPAVGAGAAPAAAGPSPYAAASSSSPGKEPTLPQDALKPRFEAIVAKDPSNSRCFDCGSHDHEWASVSFGILLCITCAGHHRQLGTHISRVRSCKMDSWTERQLSIFNSGGNKRMADFFQANGVPTSQGFQRYSTAAADWYREAWIKSRTLGRPVPTPLQGVKVGPCVDDSQQAKAKAAASPVDLLDMGEKSGPSVPVKAVPETDLLNFDATPAAAPQKRQETDLLGSGGGDLLGLSAPSAPSAPSAQANDLLSAMAGAPLDFGAQAAQAATPAMPSFPAATAPSAQSPMNFQVPNPPSSAPAPAAAPPNGSNTLAAGAKLVEQPKEKADDPFAMALKQWGM